MRINLERELRVCVSKVTLTAKPPPLAVRKTKALPSTGIDLRGTNVSPRPKIVAAARGGRDDEGDGFALIKIRLRECSFKVQGVQEFKCQN